MLTPKSSVEDSFVEPVQSQQLFRSDFYEIKHWSFEVMDPQPVGYNDCFCMVFVRTGRFAVDLATKSCEMHTGYVVVEKTDYEYRLRPATGTCSIFNFTTDFYEQFIDDHALQHSAFFGNPNLLTLLLTTSPAIEYLHHQILDNGYRVGKLELDQLVFNLVQQVVERLENSSLTEPLSPAMKKFHLTTVEQAKAYLTTHFNRDTSLLDLSSHCCVSPFHLSRLFKEYTGYSPHRYLITVRLTHAERLLRDTLLPITDVCYASGFNSLEHFATAFRQKHGLSPTQYRKR